jgi:hypothetical protein
VVTDTYDYDAFGNLIHSTGTTPNNYLFAGEQFDPDLNLYYNRARYLNMQASALRKCPSIPSWTLIDVPTTDSILIYSQFVQTAMGCQGCHGMTLTNRRKNVFYARQE